MKYCTESLLNSHMSHRMTLERTKKALTILWYSYHRFTSCSWTWARASHVPLRCLEGFRESVSRIQVGKELGLRRSSLTRPDDATCELLVFRLFLAQGVQPAMKTSRSERMPVFELSEASQTATVYGTVNITNRMTMSPT